MPEIQLLSLILLHIYIFKTSIFYYFYFSIYFLSEELNAPGNGMVLSRALFVAEGNRVLNDYAVNKNPWTNNEETQTTR